MLMDYDGLNNDTLFHACYMEHITETHINKNYLNSLE